MVIDEVYRILQYAFDNKLTIKEAITKLYEGYTRKMAESERFSQMFHTSIGLVKPNREFVLCKVA